MPVRGWGWGWAAAGQSGRGGATEKGNDNPNLMCCSPSNINQVSTPGLNMVSTLPMRTATILGGPPYLGAKCGPQYCPLNPGTPPPNECTGVDEYGVNITHLIQDKVFNCLVASIESNGCGSFFSGLVSLFWVAVVGTHLTCLFIAV